MPGLCSFGFRRFGAGDEHAAGIASKLLGPPTEALGIRQVYTEEDLLQLRHEKLANPSTLFSLPCNLSCFLYNSQVFDNDKSAKWKIV